MHAWYHSLTNLDLPSLNSPYFPGFGLIYVMTCFGSVFLVIALIGMDAGAIFVADRVIVVFTMGLAGWLHMYPDRVRNMVRSLLLSKREQGASAASVASFLGGGVNPAQVHTTAKRLFRAVSIDMVSKLLIF